MFYTLFVVPDDDHHHDDEEDNHGEHGQDKPIQDEPVKKKMSLEEIIGFVDEILETDDKDKDGYINWSEFMMAQQERQARQNEQQQQQQQQPSQ